MMGFWRLIALCVGLTLSSTQAQADNAQQMLAGRVDALVARYGPHDSRLVTPLKALGAHYFRKKDYRQAVTTYRRAQHLLHRNHGVQTLDQLDLVDWMATNEMLAGNIEAANTQQSFYYQLHVHAYGATDARTLPAVTRLADWYFYTRQMEEASYFYQLALDLIRRNNLNAAELKRPNFGMQAADLVMHDWLPGASDGPGIEQRLSYSMMQQASLEDPQALLAATYRYAGWLEQGGELIAARAIYRQARKIETDALPFSNPVGQAQLPARMLLIGSSYAGILGGR